MLAGQRIEVIACYHLGMAQILVRKLDDDVKRRLEDRARRHGRSTEAEVREILRSAVADQDHTDQDLGARIAARFAEIGLDQDIPELRGEAARPADLSG